MQAEKHLARKTAFPDVVLNQGGEAA